MRPRIRSIKPEYWQDERVVALSRSARLLLIGLMTMADDEGRFRARRSTLLGHIFPGDDDALEMIDEWIAEIREQALVLFYVSEGTPYGAFRHWRRHQKINRPTPSDLPPPPDPKVVKANRVKRQGASNERNGSGHPPLTESSVSAHSPTRRRAFRSDPDPVPVLSMPTAELRTRALCHRLAIHIQRHDPKATPSYESERWTTDMRLLVEDRGGGEPAFLEVERIIDWCQADSFWRSNVLSPAKLRKQFTQLVLKANAKPLRVVSPLHTSREMTPEAQARIDRRLAQLQADEEAS